MAGAVFGEVEVWPDPVVQYLEMVQCLKSLAKCLSH